MKEHLFTMHGWYVTLVHNLVLGGIVMFGIFASMQWYGVQVAIEIPTIEHTFKTAHK